MQCIKYGFVFEIFSNDNVTKRTEILIDNSRGLRNAAYVQETLSRYLIDDLNNIRCFLKSCRRRVNCYACRTRQFEKLQVIRKPLAVIVRDKMISEMHLCRFVLWSCDVSNQWRCDIESMTFGIRRIDTSEFFNAILYLCYHPAEVRWKDWANISSLSWRRI